MPIRTLAAVLFFVFFLGCSTLKGVYHTVGEGQTLYRIAKTYNVNRQYLARINGIKDPTQLQVGDKLFIPGAAKVKKISPLAKTVSSSNVAPLKAKVAEKKAEKTARVNKEPQISSKENAANTKSVPVRKDRFVWPLKGEIVKKFGDKGKAPSKGVEIQAPVGSAVVSAGAGRVIYSGNAIRGYGNLIVIEHDESFVTVYGFNKENLVKEDAFVSKGGKIALSGAPPGGGAPSLYFEIRYGKKAVNPTFYLP